MNTSDFLECRLSATILALVLAVMSGLAPHAGAQDTERPQNVIFILSDDHRYDFMGFHENGPDFLETPAMDKMAAEGAHLANAFVSTSLCSPSRATILTGQYAHRHGVVDNNRLVPDGTRFFPQDLQEAGYRTAFIGKWHMGGATDEPRPGFDRWVSFRGQGSYYDPTLNIDGERRSLEGYTADILTEYALDWLEERASSEEPFFMYLSHKSVHARFKPAERHAGIYGGTGFDDSRETGSGEPSTVPEPQAEPVEPAYPETMYEDAPYRETWPEWVKEQRSSWHGVDYMYHGDLDFDNFYRRYAETLRGLDDSIGEVLSYLEESGLDDETLVIYMGDNGFSFGEHGLIDKRHAFEESMRVPMLAWAPGFIESGTVIDELILNTDIAPTLLDLGRTSMPEDHTIDGRSFAPLLAGEDIPWRDEIFYEYYWEWNFPQTPTQFALRTDRYKYIFYYGLWTDGALFDLQEDPMETRNLINDEEYQDLARELRGRLFEKLRATGGMNIPLREPRGGQQDETRPPGESSTDPLNDE